MIELRKIPALICGVFLSFASPPLWASFSNENSIVLGDLAAGMGGAAVAVVGDSAGAPYYNPATLSFLEGQAFSAAVGIYKKFDILYGHEEDVTKAPLRLNQGYFRSLPSSTGSVVRWKHLPDWVLALSVIVPDYEQFKGDLKNDGTNISALNYTDESLWVGGSMARKISESEGVGFSLYYTARNFTRSASDRQFPAANHTVQYTNEKSQNENALVPILGYYNRFNDYWSFGLSVRCPSLKVQGRATLYESSLNADGGSGTVTVSSLNLSEKAVRVYVPPKITLGASYRFNPEWMMAADVSLREGFSYNEIEDGSMISSVKHRALVNGALGVEGFIYDWLKTRVGVYTNFSSQPNPDPDVSTPQEDHVDMLGFSANLVFIAGQKISYTFGGYYTGGHGRSAQRIDGAYTIVPKTTNVFTMLVGTSFSF